MLWMCAILEYEIASGRGIRLIQLIPELVRPEVAARLDISELIASHGARSLSIYMAYYMYGGRNN
jgi:hypothetical protein